MATDKEIDARTQLSEALWNDPEARAEMEKHIVRKYPGAVAHMPNVALRQEAEKILTKAEETHDKTLAELRARDAREALKAARDEIKSDPLLHIGDDEIEAVEKIMVDDSIGSHRRAAQLYRLQREVASPRGGSFTMQVPGLAGAGGDQFAWLAPGIGRPMELDRVTREQAETIMNDFAAGRGSKWL